MSDIKVKKDTDARVFDMSIDIDASPDAVWSALTDARELTRWFPLEARVIPGEGGSMYWGWGEGWAGESKIAEWEPNRRLKLICMGAGLFGPVNRRGVETARRAERVRSSKPAAGGRLGPISPGTFRSSTTACSVWERSVPPGARE